MGKHDTGLTGADHDLSVEELSRLLRALLRNDFASFVHKAFLTVCPDQPYLHNWHIEALAWHLEQVANGNITRLLITMPPRSLKSTVVSSAFPAWLLGHRPGKQIIGVSYSQDLANRLANDTRAIMQTGWYQQSFPGTRLDPKKNTESDFMTTRRGFRFSTSVGGTLTGRAGDIIIIDDPQKPADAYSDTQREKLIDWYRNTLLSRLNNKNTGAIVVVMQRVHADDLAAHLMEEGGWVHLDLPAIAEEDQDIAIGDGRVHSRKAGDVLHPDR